MYVILSYKAYLHVQKEQQQKFDVYETVQSPKTSHQRSVNLHNYVFQMNALDCVYLEYLCYTLKRVGMVMAGASLLEVQGDQSWREVYFIK